MKKKQIAGIGLLLTILFALSFGCIQQTQTATISGIVLLGPTCPVVQNPPDPSCADQPYETSLVLTTPDQVQVVQQFRSRADGTFSIQVAPGSYAIRSAAAANVLPYCSTNEPFRVSFNEPVFVTVYCDTGIR